MSVNLPIVSNCDNCGACCREQGSPPMYLWYLRKIEEGMNDSDPDWSDDHDRVTSLPPEAMRELLEYRERLLSNPPSDDGVCIWFDESTLRCRHYEHRPDICRDGLNPGDEGCIAWRRAYGVGSIDEVPTELVELVGDLELRD